MFHPPRPYSFLECGRELEYREKSPAEDSPVSSSMIQKASVGWLLGGLMLGLVQVAAVAIKKPLGVSTQYVVADTQVLEAVNPAYVEGHALISKTKYREPGYSWWLALGIPVGAFLAALLSRRWRPSNLPLWWRENHGPSIGKRFLWALFGGFFILLGSRIAHGCTSGQFASGWAQLSVSALPFTVGLFGVAMLVARFVFPATPKIEE